MAAVTSSTRFVADHNAGSPADPNLVGPDDIAAYMLIDSVAISSATSKAVSTVNAAAPDSASISTASSKATSAASQASVADSKALSGSSNTSVADSKGVSGSVNTSVADSKATSIATALIIPAVNNLPGFLSPATGAVIRTANNKMADILSVKDFGAVGDGVTDDTAAFQQALTTIKASQKGTKLFVPPGTYKMTSGLICDNAFALVIEGCSGPHGTSNDSTTSTLCFTQSGSAACISLKSAINVTLRGLRIVYTNPSYTGTVVDAGGTGGYDTTYFRMERCQVGGTSTSFSAAFGVSLFQAIHSQVSACLFTFVQYGTCGQNGGGYSNSIQIENSLFFKYGVAAHYNAGENWLFKGNTYEGSIATLGAAYVGDIDCTGPVAFLSCWFGDASVAGSPWIKFRGSALNVLHCMIGGVQPTDSAIELVQPTGATSAVLVVGNTFLGGGPLVRVTGAALIVDLTIIANRIDGGALAIVDASNKVQRKFILGGAQTYLGADQNSPVNFGDYISLGAVDVTPSTSTATAQFLRLRNAGGIGVPVDSIGFFPPGVAGNGVPVTFWTLIAGAWVNSASIDSTGVTTKLGIFPGNTTAVGAAGIYGGSGAPSSGLGANGNYYFRSDTPGTANQRLYVKSAGSWVGIL